MSNYLAKIKFTTTVNIIFTFTTCMCITIGLIPMLFNTLDTNEDNHESLDLLPLSKYSFFAAITIMIPVFFHILADLFCKCSFKLKARDQRIILVILIIVPNLLYLLFTKSSYRLSILLNLQNVVIFTLIFSCIISGYSKSNISTKLSVVVVLLFQVAALLVIFSSITKYAVLAQALLAVALFALLLCFLSFKVYLSKILSIGFNIYQMFTNHPEILIKDQEIFVYLFSLSVCTGGYFVYTILLLCTIDDDLALFFLIVVQIISVLPVLYLESRIAKLLAFQLQLELESKKVFLRTTSHEIRTPMNTIVLGLSLMRKEMLESGIQNNDLLEIIKNLDESAEVVLDLVNDLLSHDKIKEGTMLIDKTPQSLWGLVEYTTEPFYTQAKQSGVELSVDTSAIPNVQDYYIDGDKHKLSQVFRNLLSNALKFTKKGKKVILKAVKIVDRNSLPNNNINENIHGFALHKKISYLNLLRRNRVVENPVQVEQTFLQVEVIDQGAGISPENIGRLFKEIVQFNAAKLQGGKGSGLGMMITKGIVDLHGGNISVHSEGEGHGCTFTVYLPVYLRRSKTIRRRNSLFSVNCRSSSANSSLRHVNPATHISPLHRGLSNIHRPHDDLRSTSRDIETGGGGTGNNDHRGVGVGGGCLTRVGVESGTEDSLQLRTSSIGCLELPPFEYQLSSKEDQKEKDKELHYLHFHQSQSQSQWEKQGILTQPISSQHSLLSLTNELRILIVDDAKLNRKMLCRLIQGRCLETVEAENGFDAVEAVKISIADEFPYDVILMDNRMPVMDGLTATKAIRELGYSGLIVGVTGDTQKEDYAAFLSHGANSVVEKPLNLEILDKTIYDYFGAKRQNSTDKEDNARHVELA